MSGPESQHARGINGFQQEWKRCWQAVPDKALFFGLLVPWILLFQFLGSSTFGYVDTGSLFGWMYNVYTMSPDDGHCLFIPLVVAGLFWWKREQLLAVPKANWWPGISLVIMGLMFHLVGYMVQQARISIVGFFIGLYGLTGMVWGIRWLRASFFPFFLFAFCIPLGSVATAITFPLRLLVSIISAGIGHGLLGVDVVREGTLLFDSQHTFQYDVAAACSGIRSLTVLLALTTVYGFVTFRSGWKRLLMVLVAFPLAVVGNVIRITGVIITAEAFGQKAGMVFHDGAGFVTFAVALVCVMFMGAWLRDEEPAGAAGNPTL